MPPRRMSGDKYKYRCCARTRSDVRTFYAGRGLVRKGPRSRHTAGDGPGSSPNPTFYTPETKLHQSSIGTFLIVGVLAHARTVAVWSGGRESAIAQLDTAQFAIAQFGTRGLDEMHSTALDSITRFVTPLVLVTATSRDGSPTQLWRRAMLSAAHTLQHPPLSLYPPARDRTLRVIGSSERPWRAGLSARMMYCMSVVCPNQAVGLEMPGLVQGKNIRQTNSNPLTTIHVHDRLEREDRRLAQLQH